LVKKKRLSRVNPPAVSRVTITPRHIISQSAAGQTMGTLCGGWVIISILFFNIFLQVYWGIDAFLYTCDTNI